jgi:hypothetical protein
LPFTSLTTISAPPMLSAAQANVAPEECRSDQSPT